MCITCGIWGSYKDMQAGHFVAGRGNGILFDERGVHPQCYVCNIKKHGNLLEYYELMEKKFGRDTMSELRILAKTPRQLRRSDYEEIYLKYKAINNRSKQERLPTSTNRLGSNGVSC